MSFGIVHHQIFEELANQFRSRISMFAAMKNICSITKVSVRLFAMLVTFCSYHKALHHSKTRKIIQIIIQRNDRMINHDTSI